MMLMFLKELENEEGGVYLQKSLFIQGFIIPFE